MSKYLISKTEVYRTDTDNEAEALINAAKKHSDYTLTKYSRNYKEQKQKGEVVDAWYRVSLTKVFDSEKEPVGVEAVSDE